MSTDSRLLNLKPISADDTQAVQQILDMPRLARRQLLSGVRELHPVEWSKNRLTFGVRLDDELFGSIELHRDDEDPKTWELSVVLADHKRALDGARSAVAGVFYAFEQLNASAVWFWAPSSNELIKLFAQEMHFTQLNTLSLPGGTSAQTFELEKKTWEKTRISSLPMFLRTPVEISDQNHRWRGELNTFRRL